jgi:transcriptional regulator with PAS, ATPase and Fis domain
VVLSDDDLPIGLDLLPPDLQERIPAGPAGQTTLREEIARTERRVIADALRQSKGNKSQAARDLKVSYPSLLKKIKEYGLEPAKK